MSRFCFTCRGRQVFVGNLSWETTEENLKEHFASVGEVVKAQVHQPVVCSSISSPLHEEENFTFSPAPSISLTDV